ncbi:nucleotidyltransferase family protein [Angustibacter sp. Root456]|uniref:nucleotidyltransferase domain-containing protein n=1 Tax=Angustibacter sp. Root456 TaxID=1736539 RepID=UPI000701B7D8|nr:nucleotidyltransferase family protein [Angustibacter sp. Root456]KQX62909.1 hypothetical protein ASD06_12910 [Angustibacter sp. Root456]
MSTASTAAEAPASMLSRRQRADFRRVLIDCLDGEPLTGAWPHLPSDLLARGALEHGVAPAVWVGTRGRPELPAELADVLRRAHAAQLFQHMRSLSELETVRQALDGAGVPWVVVKGPVLAESLWARPDLRLYGDLDVLVHPEHLGEALQALQDAGSQLVDRNWPMIREQHRAELTLRLPHGTALDLHWNLVNEAELRSVFVLSTSELLARAQHVDLSGHRVPTLDSADTVVHLAYHSVHSGGHKLVWFKDVERALAAPGVHPALVRERADRAGCGLLLDLVVRRSQRLFGRPVPQPLRRSSLWSRVADAADAWRPVPNPPGTRFSGQIVFANTRRSSLASAVAAVRDSTRSREPRDFSLPNPLHEDHPDAEARHDYLAAVARER